MIRAMRPRYGALFTLMIFNRVFRRGFGLVFGLILVLIGIALWPVGFTQVSIEQRQCRLVGHEFQLAWRHSVEKTQWIEHYQRQQDHFLLSSTELVSFGAGTPSNAPVIALNAGKLQLLVNRRLAQLDWFISKNMQGRIISDQSTWYIYQDFPDYSLVQFRAKQAPLWQLWRMEACP